MVEKASIEDVIKVLIVSRNHDMQQLWSTCSHLVARSGLPPEILAKHLPIDVVAEIEDLRLKSSFNRRPILLLEEQKIRRMRRALDSSEVELVELMVMGEGLNLDEKSFWQFRRSSSRVNCDRGGGGLLRSLQFLTRSNSTGSVPNPKPSVLAKVMQKQNLMWEPPITRRSSPAPGINNQFYHYNKPSQGKSSSRSYNNGVRINPVLNIAPNYTLLT